MVRALRSHRKGRRFNSYIAHQFRLGTIVAKLSRVDVALLGDEGHIKEGNMSNLGDQIKILVELQGLDSQIFKLEEEIKSIPEKIKEMDDSSKEKAAGLKKLEDNVKALTLKRKEKEGELESKEGAIKKYQTQMFQVKTNKEYTTFQGEIARAKADNSIVEEDILKIFDQIDIENKKIAIEKENLKKEEAVLLQEKKRLTEEGETLKIQLDALKTQRVPLAEKVDKDILLKYEKILKNKDGLAVVPVVNASCQGCFGMMPAQVLNEIRMKDKIITCENCARILYIDE